MLKALRFSFYFLFLTLTVFTYGIDASNPPNSSPSAATQQLHDYHPVTAALINEDGTVQPGQSFWLAVQLKMDKHWHTYWKNPGDAGMTPRISWTLPEGFKAGEIVWATPKRFTVDTAVGFGYENELVLLVEITPPTSYNASTAKIDAEVRWVACSDNTCLPGMAKVDLNLPVSAKAPEKIVKNIALFSQARAKIPKKHETVSAQNEDSLLQISFNDPSKEKHTVKDVEFFPDTDTSINYSVPPLLQPSTDTPGSYTVVLEQLTPQARLKGVLVVHTDAGSNAYDIDTKVVPVARNDQVASVSSIGSNTQASIPSQAHRTNALSYEFEGGLPLALVLAFIGGMILNLMPCVLPVISFKILSFIKLAGESRKLIFKHGIAFSAGVLLSFWILAALLLVLQAYGRSAGWGFQLQEPLFVAILAAFIFVFGLSLFGLLEIGTTIMSKAGEAQHQSGKGNALLGSFLSGILATAVATPCTGPFLGSTVGFAVTLPPYQAMLIFTSLGLGMSFPYLLLAAFPSLLRLMPKPGPWMITFKEIMGFLMMASVLWLTWVFSAQTGTLAVSIFLAGLFLLSVACWIYGRWATPMSKKFTRRFGMVAALAFFAMGSYTIVAATSSSVQAMEGHTTASKLVESEIADVWEEFSPERLAALRAQGIPVFVDFTAKWCLICQANHLVLSTNEVAQKFTEAGVVRMKADWTKSNEVITAELKKFGRNSVPLYIMYDSDPVSEAKILPQVLTPETVLEAIEQIQVTL